MTTPTDDMIRSSVRDLAGQPDGRLDRAREDVRRRIVRRRRRRRLLFGATVLVVGVGAVLLLPRDRGQVVATGAAAGVTDPETPVPTTEDLVDATPFLTLEWMEASGGPDGTDRVVLVFDKEVPKVPVVLVDDVTSPEPSAVSYTTQPGVGDEGRRICGNVHWFPGVTKGSVDVLLPNEWFAPGSEAYRREGPLRMDPARPIGGKITTCRYEGFIQLSISAPASSNPADVTLSVEANTITIEIEPADSEQTDPTMIACPVNTRSASTNPRPPGFPREYMGDGLIWTAFPIQQPYPVEERQGRYQAKFPWYRVGEPQELKLAAEPLTGEGTFESRVPDGYADDGFQPSELFFSKLGCWRVTATYGDSSLEVWIDIAAG